MSQRQPDLCGLVVKSLRKIRGNTLLVDLNCYAVSVPVGVGGICKSKKTLKVDIED